MTAGHVGKGASPFQTFREPLGRDSAAIVTGVCCRSCAIFIRDEASLLITESDTGKQGRRSKTKFRESCPEDIIVAGEFLGGLPAMGPDTEIT